MYWLSTFSKCFQLFSGVSEVGVNLESGFEFLFSFSVRSLLNHHLTEFVVGHIIIRADSESFAIQSNRLLAVAAGLSPVKVIAKRAIAVARFLVLQLLPRYKIVDFLPLPRELYFLSSKLFRLFFQNFRIAADEKARSNNEPAPGS